MTSCAVDPADDSVEGQILRDVFDRVWARAMDGGRQVIPTTALMEYMDAVRVQVYQMPGVSRTQVLLAIRERLAAEALQRRLQHQQTARDAMLLSLTLSASKAADELADVRRRLDESQYRG